MKKIILGLIFCSSLSLVLNFNPLNNVSGQLALNSIISNSSAQAESFGVGTPCIVQPGKICYYASDGWFVTGVFLK